MEIERKIVIHNGNIFPSTLIVSSGSIVNIKIINNDNTSYIFEIPGLSKKLVLSAFETTTLKVKVSSQGMYTFKLDGLKIGEFVVL